MSRLSDAVRGELDRQLRISILVLLHGLPRYRCAFDTLAAAIRSLSHGASRVELRAELDWLAEKGLLTLSETRDEVAAQLTNRGAEAAAGDAFVDGVAKLRPDLVL